MKELATIVDEEAIDRMIDSREWWILVGDDELYDDLSQEFYSDAPRSYLTVMGPVPTKFRPYFDGRMMVLHFARKDRLPPERLIKFLLDHPSRGDRPFPIPRPDQDIIILLREGEMK